MGGTERSWFDQTQQATCPYNTLIISSAFSTRLYATLCPQTPFPKPIKIGSLTTLGLLPHWCPVSCLGPSFFYPRPVLAPIPSMRSHCSSKAYVLRVSTWAASQPPILGIWHIASCDLFCNYLLPLKQQQYSMICLPDWQKLKIKMSSLRKNVEYKVTTYSHHHLQSFMNA